MKLMAQRAFLSLVAATHATIERTETFVREERARCRPFAVSLSLPEFSSMRMWSCLRRRIVATLPVAPILLVLSSLSAAVALLAAYPRNLQVLPIVSAAVERTQYHAPRKARPPAPRPLFGEHFTDIHEHYIIGRKLGSGNFAKVVLGTSKRDLPQWKLKAGDGVAIKVVKKPTTSHAAAERVQMLRAEVEILRSMRHPNIVQLYEFFESETKLYLVMELLTGGELFDRIVGLGRYSEEDARYFTFKLLNAVLYLHDRNICHRDLKPENILLETKSPNSELKITDFGLSKIQAISEDLLMTTRCGTPGYVAPEVLSEDLSQGLLRRYGAACDMWSVGVIVYILLCAAPPFYGKTDAEMNKRIKTGHYRFPEKYWAHVSADAKDFISRLLCVDPTRRMSASEALQHNWMVQIGIHTNDLFNMQGYHGVPVMQARFDEFNHERRSMTRRHLAFLAYDQSTMFSLPITEVCSVQPVRAHEEMAESDHSILLSISNGKQVQFDGFWEREGCLELLQACGRFLKHQLVVEPAEAPTAEQPATAIAAAQPPASADTSSAPTGGSETNSGQRGGSGTATDIVAAIEALDTASWAKTADVCEHATSGSFSRPADGCPIEKSIREEPHEQPAQ
ncbi:hypothetical protein AB1Y20_009376 [Prymnesium parvum]|uniref:Protein kinase domain-containing protein n=1 Tax=Prymnesium parvum TaxID=97485 RepID=A0AB34K1W0_PRYPA